MGHYKLTRLAEQDIEKIYEYTIVNFGLEQAKKYLHGMTGQFESLSENPKLFPERSEFTPPVRVCPYRSHIIVYHSLSDDSIEIIRVRHGREDWLQSST